MIYDDEEEEDYFEEEHEEKESVHTNDFDMQGFPVHEAVDFYHKKTLKQPKQEFQLLDIQDMVGSKGLRGTNLMGNEILGTGSLGKLMDKEKKQKKGKKGKKKTKSTGLIGNNSIFRL